MSFGLLCEVFAEQEGNLEHLPALPSPRELSQDRVTSSCGSRAGGWRHPCAHHPGLGTNLAGEVAGDKFDGSGLELPQKHLEGPRGESVTSVTLSLMAPSEVGGLQGEQARGVTALPAPRLCSWGTWGQLQAVPSV